MRLKSFYANTMTEAMQMVRKSLGEDAIIVATREENGGKAVRVTAAVDSITRATLAARDAAVAFELGKDGVPAAEDNWLQYDDEQEADGALSEAIMDALLRHNAPEDILDQMVNCASLMEVDEPIVAFIGALDTLFNFVPLPNKAYKKAMMFVGPPGAGKTLAVAKLAARGVMDGLNISVITTDTVRAGGVEQLQAFTKLLKIDLKTAKTPDELTHTLKSLPPSDQILIDTTGFNPFNATDMKTLAKWVAAGDIEPILVLPAAGDANESGEIARVFSAMGVRRFVPSRLDIARRLGGLLAASQHGGLAFSDGCSSSKVADGLSPMSPRKLAGYFFSPTDKKALISDTLPNNTNPHRQPTSKKSTG